MDLPAGRRRLTILLIEEAPAAAGMVGRMLEAMGHEVLRAADGLDGWRKVSLCGGG